MTRVLKMSKPTEESVNTAIKKILATDPEACNLLFGVWHYKTFEEFSTVDPGNRYIDIIKDLYSLGKEALSMILMQNNIFFMD
jgi:hypothetical protein